MMFHPHILLSPTLIEEVHLMKQSPLQKKLHPNSTLPLSMIKRLPFAKVVNPEIINFPVSDILKID